MIYKVNETMKIIRLIYQFAILFNEIKLYKKFINEFESMRKSEYYSKTAGPAEPL